MSEDELIAAMAQVMARDDDPAVIEMYRAFARDALAVARPIIEKQERERCVREAQKWVCASCGDHFHPDDNCSCDHPDWLCQRNPEQIVYAIRKLKELEG